jgi:hypothetical protein
MKKLIILSIISLVTLLSPFGMREVAARPCDITVPTEQATIQDAINSANPGNKICVKPGTYTEDLFIDKDNLELAGSGFPTVMGVGKGDTSVNSFPTAVPNINIQANGVKIHNFTIMSPTITSGVEYASGIVLTGTDIEIYKNHFVVSNGTPGSQGIQTWALDNAPLGNRDISGLKIYKNRFTSTGSSGFGYEAIFINPQSDPVPQGKPGEVVIEKNFFSGELYRAIGIQRGNASVEKNKMSTDLAPTSSADFGDVPWGIKVFDGFDGTNPAQLGNVNIEKNKIGFGGAAQFNVGIRLESLVTDTSVDKNHIKSPFQDGISVAGDGNSFEKNKVQNAGANGILVEGDNNSFRMNIVKGSANVDINDVGLGNSFFKNKCDTSTPVDVCTP